MWSDEIVVGGGEDTYSGATQCSLTSDISGMCTGADQISIVRFFDPWCVSQCSCVAVLRSLSVSGLGFFALRFPVLILFHLFVPGLKNASCESLLRYRCVSFSLALMDLLLTCVFLSGRRFVFAHCLCPGRVVHFNIDFDCCLHCLYEHPPHVPVAGQRFEFLPRIFGWDVHK